MYKRKNIPYFRFEGIGKASIGVESIQEYHLRREVPSSRPCPTQSQFWTFSTVEKASHSVIGKIKELLVLTLRSFVQKSSAQIVLIKKIKKPRNKLGVNFKSKPSISSTVPKRVVTACPFRVGYQSNLLYFFSHSLLLYTNLLHVPVLYCSSKLQVSLQPGLLCTLLSLRFSLYVACHGISKGFRTPADDSWCHQSTFIFPKFVKLLG